MKSNNVNLVIHIVSLLSFFLFTPSNAFINQNCQRSNQLIQKGLVSSLRNSKPQFASEFSLVKSNNDAITRKDPQPVKIADSTLRQGDYDETCQMEPEDKIRVATQLVKLGVDILEVGEPSVSPTIASSIKQIVDTVGTEKHSPVIMALCLAEKQSIKTTYEAIQKSAHPRLHLIVSADDLHNCVADECRVDLVDELLKQVSEAVTYAKSLCDDIQFSTEDAFRIAREDGGAFLLKEIYSTAINAGVSTINLEDSYGFCTPNEIKTLILQFTDPEEGIKGVDGVTISLSCYDDLGLSVANYLAGVQSGARQLQCTVNGIGERAGVSALEEVVMALKVRSPYYNKYFGRESKDKTPLTAINTKQISKTSKLVADLTGIRVQRNKAIVGENAFAHESGIHQDGFLKHPETYEIVSAADIGLGTKHLVLGKHSGRHAFRDHLTQKMGLDPRLLRDEQIDKAFRKFKELSDVKKEVTEMELEALVNDELYRVKRPRFEYSSMQVYLGTAGVPTVTVTVFDHVERREVSETVTQDSGLTAAFNALEKVTKMPDVKLMSFGLGSKSAGVEAVGEAVLHLKCLESQKVFYGRGSHHDVIVAGTKSYVDALNRIYSYRSELTKGLIDLQLAGERRRTYQEFSELS